YHLNPGEIIVAEFAGDSHVTRVEEVNDENRQYEPCLWYPHGGRYYAVMFSASKLRSEVTPPQRYRADAGLMHRDYAYPRTEFTEAELRWQSFVRDDGDDTATPIVTVVWRVPAEFAGCASTCFGKCSAGPEEGTPHQQGPHISTHRATVDPDPGDE